MAEILEVLDLDSLEDELGLPKIPIDIKKILPMHPPYPPIPRFMAEGLRIPGMPRAKSRLEMPREEGLEELEELPELKEEELKELPEEELEELPAEELEKRVTVEKGKELLL